MTDARTVPPRPSLLPGARRRAFALAAALVFLGAGLSVAYGGQQSKQSKQAKVSATNANTAEQTQPNITTELNDTDPVMAASRLRAQNAERQKSMVSDTNKLLKLAKELDAEVRAGNSTALTPAELHKVAEIEKLARNVKEKMTLTVGGSSPAFRGQTLTPEP
jgi:uncharacterized protein HemX